MARSKVRQCDEWSVKPQPQKMDNYRSRGSIYITRIVVTLGVEEIDEFLRQNDDCPCMEWLGTMDLRRYFDQQGSVL